MIDECVREYFSKGWKVYHVTAIDYSLNDGIIFHTNEDTFLIKGGEIRYHSNFETKKVNYLFQQYLIYELNRYIKKQEKNLEELSNCIDNIKS